MRIFKYRTFEKWANKQGLTDEDLKKVMLEIENGLMDANLGDNVYKKRISRQGQGKSGAYRTLLLMKRGDKVIFAHGFAKGEKDNISKNELEGFKIMAEALLNLSDTQIQTLIENKNLTELSNE